MRFPTLYTRSFLDLPPNTHMRMWRREEECGDPPYSAEERGALANHDRNMVMLFGSMLMSYLFMGKLDSIMGMAGIAICAALFAMVMADEAGAFPHQRSASFQRRLSRMGHVAAEPRAGNQEEEGQEPRQEKPLTEILWRATTDAIPGAWPMIEQGQERRGCAKQADEDQD